MATVVLQVVAEEDMGLNPSVLRQPEDKPPFTFITSDGETDYLCGECGFMLMQGINAGQVERLFLQCPRCRSFNRTRL